MIYNSTTKICVVTVTYGSRGHLLTQVIDALSKSTVRVDSVVIVDNGSNGSFENILSLGVCKIDIIKNEINMGSAAGFKHGLHKASESGCDLVWLLDDDNIPEPCALEKILEKREMLGNNKMHVFASQRLGREKYVKAANTNFNLEVKKNAFLGFSVTDLPSRLLRKFLVNSKFAPEHLNKIGVKQIGYGIYGGLLLHHHWLEKKLYPDERLYLYMDDTEYTTRLIRNGAHIYLVPDSKIKDIDISWSQKSLKQRTPILDMNVDIKKLYYTIRNSCFLSKERFVDNRVLFLINMVIFMALMFIKGILSGISFPLMINRYKLIFHAVSDGIKNRLGYKEYIVAD
jgi:GT2 family glycosyltransferase